MVDMSRRREFSGLNGQSLAERGSVLSDNSSVCTQDLQDLLDMDYTDRKLPMDTDHTDRKLPIEVNVEYNDSRGRKSRPPSDTKLSTKSEMIPPRGSGQKHRHTVKKSMSLYNEHHVADKPKSVNSSPRVPAGVYTDMPVTARLCFPCWRQGRYQIASSFCENCKPEGAHICSQCRAHHRKFPELGHHRIRAPVTDACCGDQDTVDGPR